MLLRPAFTVVVPFNSYGYFRFINEIINWSEGKVLVFGHIGITAGIIKGCDILTAPAKSPDRYPPDSDSESGVVVGGQRLRFRHLLGRIRSQAGVIDYRMVVLGSLLPDIIDKPVWFLVTGITDRTALSGRDYAHTLLFNLVLIIGGLVLMRYGKLWLSVIALCSFGHLVLDQIWHSPVVLLWPLLGPLAAGETAGWLPGTIQALFSRPEVYVPEIIGLVVVAFFAYRLVTRKRVFGFVRDGAIG